MTRITVYDIEAEKIAKLAEAEDTTEAEIVEMIMDFAESEGLFK